MPISKLFQKLFLNNFEIGIYFRRGRLPRSLDLLAGLRGLISREGEEGNRKGKKGIGEKRRGNGRERKGKYKDP